MTSQFSYSFKLHLKKEGLPLVFITQNEADSGFCFLIDTSVKNNYIDKFYLEFYHAMYNTDLLKDFDFDPANVLEFKDECKDIYRKCGTKQVISRNLIKEELEIFEINFKISNKKFIDKFYLSEVACEFQKWNNKYQILGVLGNKFLLKNKWIIDYDSLLIYSKK